MRQRAPRPPRGDRSRRSALAGTTYALIEAPGNGGSALRCGGRGALGVVALVAFVLAERPSAAADAAAQDLLRRQFSAANMVTFVVYAALGGVFFLLVSFLQISLGYSPLAAGAASLPVTLLMLLFSARSACARAADRPPAAAHARAADRRRRACC